MGGEVCELWCVWWKISGFESVCCPLLGQYTQNENQRSVPLTEEGQRTSERGISSASPSRSSKRPAFAPSRDGEVTTLKLYGSFHSLPKPPGHILDPSKFSR